MEGRGQGCDRSTHTAQEPPRHTADLQTPTQGHPHTCGAVSPWSRQEGELIRHLVQREGGLAPRLSLQSHMVTGT